MSLRSSAAVHDAHPRKRHAREKRRLRQALCVTGFILIVEVAGGLASNSVALLSDAGHMLTDLSALGLSLAAILFASLPATTSKTYGYYRLEILAALANGIVLIIVAGWILYESANRFRNPPEIETEILIGVAAVGLVANLLGIYLLSDVRGSLNLRGAFLHVLSDTLSSGAVLVGGIIIALTGWTPIDPILGSLIAVVIIMNAFRLLRESVDVLLEGTPVGMKATDVTKAIKEIDGILEVHDLHLWSITSGMPAMSAHVTVRQELIPRCDALLAAMKTALRDRFGIDHTTIQIEPEQFLQVESDSTSCVASEKGQ